MNTIARDSSRWNCKYEGNPRKFSWDNHPRQCAISWNPGTLPMRLGTIMVGSITTQETRTIWMEIMYQVSCYPSFIRSHGQDAMLVDFFIYCWRCEWQQERRRVRHISNINLYYSSIHNSNNCSSHKYENAVKCCRRHRKDDPYGRVWIA